MDANAILLRQHMNDIVRESLQKLHVIAQYRLHQVMVQVKVRALLHARVSHTNCQLRRLPVELFRMLGAFLI